MRKLARTSKVAGPSQPARKKLALSRESLRRLTGADLKVAVGGKSLLCPTGTLCDGYTMNSNCCY